jgi:hypothetical protein
MAEQRTELPMPPFANFEVVELGRQYRLDVTRFGGVYDLLPKERRVAICPRAFQLETGKDKTVKHISFETEDSDKSVNAPGQLVDRLMRR